MRADWQQYSWMAAVIAGLFAVISGSIQLIYGLVVRSKELRWNKARAGKELLDEMFDDPRAGQLLYALDVTSPRLKAEDGAEIKFSKDQWGVCWGKALGWEDHPTLELVRMHLDSLIYYFDRMEHSIRIGLVNFDDVRTPTDYYVKLLANDKQRVEQYVKDIGYARVHEDFLPRFDVWRQTSGRGDVSESVTPLPGDGPETQAAARDAADAQNGPGRALEESKSN